MLIEIRLFEFQDRNFGQLRIFGGIKFAKKLFIKFLHFIRFFSNNRNGKLKLVILARN